MLKPNVYGRTRHMDTKLNAYIGNGSVVFNICPVVKEASKWMDILNSTGYTSKPWIIF